MRIQAVLYTLVSIAVSGASHPAEGCADDPTYFDQWRCADWAAGPYNCRDGLAPVNTAERIARLEARGGAP